MRERFVAVVVTVAASFCTVLFVHRGGEPSSLIRLEFPRRVDSRGAGTLSSILRGKSGERDSYALPREMHTRPPARSPLAGGKITRLRSATAPTLRRVTRGLARIATDMCRTVTIRAKETAESGRTGTAWYHAFS
ncbi:hypothetical protein PUN28_009554 [Cardiocondyla obscurior]|uniref:Secreted protein n=1 Tax=Cardiocondyla obscurior TaxID=286306 RepID=A0AAW2FT71_9HYME